MQTSISLTANVLTELFITEKWITRSKDNNFKHIVLKISNSIQVQTRFLKGHDQAALILISSLKSA